MLTSMPLEGLKGLRSWIDREIVYLNNTLQPNVELRVYYKFKKYTRNNDILDLLKFVYSCERFLVDILLEQADLYSLVFFLNIQTFYQVLFAQVYSVRLTPIYLLLAVRTVL